MAVSKKTAAATAEKVENKEVQEATKPVEAKAPATKEATPKAAAKKVVRNAHDMIPCRSVTVGELTCESKKSKGIYYRWLNYDDIEEVEYKIWSHYVPAGRSSYTTHSLSSWMMSWRLNGA